MDFKISNIISSLLPDLNLFKPNVNASKFATKGDIEKSGLLAGTGVVLGAGSRGRYVCHNGAEHILAVGPTRSGKGTGIAIPTLLSWPYSVVVVDVRGEKWQTTAGFRQKELKNKVFKIEFTETGADFDFDIKDIINTIWPVSVYLVIQPFVRSEVVPLIQGFFKKLIAEAQYLRQYSPRILLLLDDFQELGRMDFFIEALPYMADYRLKALVMVQGYCQLKKIYANYDILDKCSVKVIYTPNDPETAEIVSAETNNLLTQDEIHMLPNDKNLILMPGIPPIKARKVFYYEDKSLVKRLLSAQEGCYI